jgi:hypothetical protein
MRSLDAEKATEASLLVEARPKLTWRVKAIAYCLMVGIACTVLEAGAYIYLRVFSGYDGQHLMNYEFDDYKNIRPTPGYRNAKGIYHNAQGFRREANVTREKQEGTYRIFIMGGSTAYGLGSLSRYGQEKYAIIKNNETIDYYLEQYLKAKMPEKQIEVINAAITSQQSHHHLIYLNQTILKYHPDMVIFIDGFNDYYPYQKGFDQFRDYAYQERGHRFMADPTVDAWAGYNGWWLFRKSHFIHLAGKTILPVWQQIGKVGSKRNRIDVDEALDNLKTNASNNFVKMVERNALILRHEGIVPVFTLQPEIVFRQSKEFSAMEKNIYAEMDGHWQENFADFKNKARPVVVDYLTKATADTGGLFFDLTDVFGGLKEDAYTDYCHLTPLGNERLAESLGSKILPLIAAKI